MLECSFSAGNQTVVTLTICWLWSTTEGKPWRLERSQPRWVAYFHFHDGSGVTYGCRQPRPSDQRGEDETSVTLIRGPYVTAWRVLTLSETTDLIEAQCRRWPHPLMSSQLMPQHVTLTLSKTNSEGGRWMGGEAHMSHTGWTVTVGRQEATKSRRIVLCYITLCWVM